MTQARILVLEDEPLIAMLVEDWLAELGHEPIGPCSRVAEALEIVRSQQLEAAILDVSVGSDTCFSVADLLKAKNVPFAFATGRSDDAIPARLEGTPVLKKPYDLHAMGNVLTALLAKPNS